jgi:hypothetical protein
VRKLPNCDEPDGRDTSSNSGLPLPPQFRADTGIIKQQNSGVVARGLLVRCEINMVGKSGNADLESGESNFLVERPTGTTAERVVKLFSQNEHGVNIEEGSSGHWVRNVWI